MIEDISVVTKEVIEGKNPYTDIDKVSSLRRMAKGSQEIRKLLDSRVTSDITLSPSDIAILKLDKILKGESYE